MGPQDLVLARIEHKIDLIIAALQHQGLMLPSPLDSLAEKGQDTCPVCGRLQTFRVDVPTESVHLACGCTLPIHIIPGISQVGRVPLNPNEKKQENDDDGPSSDGEAQQQEGSPAPHGPAPGSTRGGGRAPDAGTGDRQ